MRKTRKKSLRALGEFALESVTAHRRGVFPAYVKEGKAQSPEKIESLGERRRALPAVL